MLTKFFFAFEMFLIFIVHLPKPKKLKVNQVASRQGIVLAVRTLQSTLVQSLLSVPTQPQAGLLTSNEH